MSKTNKMDLVILVDDSDIDLFVQKKVIEITGFSDKVLSFSIPREALDYLSKQQVNNAPGIVFLDLNMPLMDGYEFLEEFGKLPIAATSKVVVVTSSNSQKDLERAFTYPYVLSFVTKPLKEADLIKIRENLNGKR